MSKKILIILSVVLLSVFLFQNMTTYKTPNDIVNSSVENFEEVRCELELQNEGRLFVVATYDLSEEIATLVVKILDDRIIEEVTLKGTRLEDEENFVSYITSGFVLRFLLDGSSGIPEAKYAILENPNQSYDLGDNCHIN